VSTTARGPAAGHRPSVASTATTRRIRWAFDELGGLCTRRPALTVTVVATLWALVLTMGMIRHLDADIYGYPGDATGTIASYAWWGYALAHGRSLLAYPWGAPFGAGLENVPLSALQVGISAPLSAVLGPVVTYNLEVLSGFPLTAWVTFVLSRQLGLPALAAAFSALAFTFMPYHLQKAMGHLGMVHLELFSGTLLFLVRWRATGRRRNLAFAGIIAGLALCLDPYDAFIDMVLVAAFFLVSVALPSPLLRGVARRLRAHVLAAAAVAAATAALVPAAVLAAHRPSGSGSYVQGVVSGAQEAARLRIELLIYSARPIEFVQPWFANPLVPQAIRQYELSNLHYSNITESTLFLGYSVIALAILGTVLVRRAVFPVVLSWAVGLAGFVFAAPPLLYQVLPGVSVSAPSYYLYSVLPFFRVYARFGVLVMLAAVLLAGFGFAAIASRLRGGWPRAFLIVPFLLMAVEFNNLPPLHTTRIFPAPPAYTWLASQPSGILVEYPLHGVDTGTQQVENSQYELYQQTHRHPILNGSATSSRMGQLEPELEPYYSPQVVSRLRALGVRYVFVHRLGYLGSDIQFPRQVDGLQFVMTLAGIDVYEVPTT
jgi:hypothetical protein